jgi:hypothetical protein
VSPLVEPPSTNSPGLETVRAFFLPHIKQLVAICLFSHSNVIGNSHSCVNIIKSNSKVFPISAVNIIMTPAIATYYPIAIVLAVAAAVAIPLWLARARRWSGAAVVGGDTNANTLLPTAVIDTTPVRPRAPRLVAISSSAVRSAGPMRSIARQSLPNRLRALDGVVSISTHDTAGLASNLAVRRPGLQKAAARCDRRLAVVR